MFKERHLIYDYLKSHFLKNLGIKLISVDWISYNSLKDVKLVVCYIDDSVMIFEYVTVFISIKDANNLDISLGRGKNYTLEEYSVFSHITSISNHIKKCVVIRTLSEKLDIR